MVQLIAPNDIAEKNRIDITVAKAVVVAQKWRETNLDDLGTPSTYLRVAKIAIFDL